jgi:hypothetical protein
MKADKSFAEAAAVAGVPLGTTGVLATLPYCLVVGYCRPYAVRSFAINAWSLLRSELSGNLRCNS